MSLRGRVPVLRELKNYRASMNDPLRRLTNWPLAGQWKNNTTFSDMVELDIFIPEYVLWLIW